jgi:hypothetical protein
VPLKAKTAPKRALCHGDALFLDLLDEGRMMNSSLTTFRGFPCANDALNEP